MSQDAVEASFAGECQDLIDKHWAFRSWNEELADEDQLVIFERATQVHYTEESQKLSMAELRMIMLESENDLNIHLDDSEESNVKLFLNYQQLYEMPGVVLTKFAIHINYLDINYNNFVLLNFLEYFPNLTTLIADHNPITTYIRLPYLPNLKTAWFNNCKLTELFPFVANLGISCPNLEYLSLMGNPCTPDFFNAADLPCYREFRLYAISIFPKLKMLDDRPIITDERCRSKVLGVPLVYSITSKSPVLQTFWHRLSSFFKFNKPADKRNTFV